MKLKEFQDDTVETVLEGLRNGVYAVADETGLGKTVICGDVARKLIEAAPGNGPFIIYYVAPSLELLDQNLNSFVEHLRATLEPAHAYSIHRVVSRLTQIPLVLAQRQPGQKHIFIIGLSPDTSFKINGWGREGERAYLAALFAYGQTSGIRRRVRDAFWCHEKKLEPGFSSKIAAFSNPEKLGYLSNWTVRQDYQELLSKIPPAGPRTLAGLKADRQLMTEVRRKIAAFTVQSRSTLPHLVIFDEWHKYKKTCFEPKRQAKPHERLVADLLAKARQSQKSKVLFVSATPFTVDYGDLQRDGGTPVSSDLRSMIQLFWDKEQFEVEYQRLLKKQQAFVQAMEQLLTHADAANLGPLKQEARRSRGAYEAELRRYCVRTERPKSALTDDSPPDADGWDQMFASGSANAFLGRFGAAKGVRSPIVSMWMDGHDFIDAGYAGLKGLQLPPIRETHWKMARLVRMLEESFGFQDGLHSLAHPPLWINPEQQRRGCKHLIFSEFHFVPDEICERLKIRSKIKDTNRFSGSVLGTFPLATKKGKRVANSGTLKRSIHFPVFFPFIFWELDPANRASRLAGGARERVHRAIETATSAVEAVLQIDEIILASDRNYAAALRLRREFVDTWSPIPATSQLRGYLTAIVDSELDRWAPGCAVARLIGAQRKRASGTQAKQYEFMAIGIAAAVMRLFVSPEAQILSHQNRKVPNALSRVLPDRAPKLLKFVLWYSERFELEATLHEFANLLAAGGKDGGAVLAEIRAAMSLKRGDVGTKFFRSFHDRKVDDTSMAEEGEEVTEKSLRTAFNSPFAPYVLASTSVGQEGLDFHRYCDSVIHWTPPGSPAALRQREGRVDRYQSLQVRSALWRLAQNGEQPDTNGHGDMCPDFVVMHRGQRANRSRRTVLYLPFTAQAAIWQLCLRRMHYDDLLIGAPDPLADERALLNALDRHTPEERARRFAFLKEFSISLRPRFGKL